MDYLKEFLIIIRKTFFVITAVIISVGCVYLFIMLNYEIFRFFVWIYDKLFR